VSLEEDMDPMSQDFELFSIDHSRENQISDLGEE
jgi:hypothetical protein